MTSNPSEAKYFWVPDDTEVWAYAVLVSTSSNNDLNKYKILKSQKTISCSASKCIAASSHLAESDSTHGHAEDLVSLHDVNHGAILYNTKQRFLNKHIYTSCGTVLMSVNPFEKIPGLYGESVISSYKNPNVTNLPTHVYIIPSRAYQMMTLFNKSQSILISGESGAG